MRHHSLALTRTTLRVGSTLFEGVVDYRQIARSLRVPAAHRVNLKAMVLLGINCGYGNMDCVRLPINRLDLDGGWADFPRTKNGIRRRNPLWPETTDALRAVLATRKTPIDPAEMNRVFITKWGKAYRAANLSREIGYVLTRARLSRNVDFYDLRRTCASIGIQVGDDDAMRTIMGHKRPGGDMLGIYNRMAVSDPRLLTVSNHIRDWLFRDLAAHPEAKAPGDDALSDDLPELEVSQHDRG